MRLRFFSVAVLALCATAAHADSVTFNLTNANQSATAGSTLYFNATTTAASGNSGVEYLNGLSEVFTPMVSSTNIDDSDYFYSTYAASLDPGTTSMGTIFSLLVPANAMAGSVFNGTITLYGGSTDQSADVLGSGSVQVTVAGSQAAAVTPEPSSVALLGTGVLGLLALGYRRARGMASLQAL